MPLGPIRRSQGVPVASDFAGSDAPLVVDASTGVLHGITDGGVVVAATSLKDGVAAPATLSGVAQIYVDVADGDLKIKFGDGTVKTIVVDT